MVLRTILAEGNCFNSMPEAQKVQISSKRFNRLLNQLAAAA